VWPASIDCGRNLAGHTDCSASYGIDSYANGAQLVLTAYPAQGQRFAGFGGDCSGTGPCMLTTDQARSVSASFATDGPVQRTLTLTTTGLGTGWVDSAPAGIDAGRNSSAHATFTRDYDDGTRVLLAAHAPLGYRFNGFSGGCTSTATAPVCELTMNQAQSVTADFAQLLPIINFSRARQTLTEGGVAAVDVTLNRKSTTQVSVQLKFSGTATVGSDYTSPPTTVTFAPGTITQHVRITTIDDTQPEPAETIVVQLVHPVNATLGSVRSFRATIKDND
jgi:hypothetical protein